jgi:hypothetical protein
MTMMPLDSSADGDRLVIYPSRAKMSLILLGSIAFVGIGIWIGTPAVAREQPLWKVVVASYVGVPFFGACGLYAVYRLAIRRPALEIDSTGITDSASAVGAGRLSWDEVDHVVLYKYSGQWMLGIIPRNLDVFLSRQPFPRRFLTKLNLALGCAPVNVPQVGLSMKVAELANLLHTRHGVRVERDA